MSDPIVFVVDPDPESLKSLAETLERRFGADYRVLTDGSAAAALCRIEQACERGEQVALVIVDPRTEDLAGLEWLARMREACPRASRCALIRYGDPEIYPIVRRALALGQLDSYLIKPVGDPEERLYPVVTEILSRWSRAVRPRVPVVEIVGERWSRRCHEMRDLLERASMPYGFHGHQSEEGRALLRRVGHDGDLPAVIFRDQVLVNPTNSDIAEMLGARTEPEADVYDLVVVGAGPSGLSTAVYAASSGMRTLVVERQAVGGQAGTSSMIRNYPGFPRGIGGAELTARAQEQAISLGAEFIITRDVMGLHADGAERLVTLAGGRQVRARAVVVATGVSYNRFEAEVLEGLMGKGVFHGSAMTEAPAFTGQDVFIVGGGDSAGQAAVHLARYAASVTLLVRGITLIMSAYLVRQMKRAGNVHVRLNTQVVRAEGERRLEALIVKDTVTGATERVAAAAAFVLIGAGPHTGWLDGVVQRDSRGYILTGSAVACDASDAAGWPLARTPLALETSLPGVFAAGDVRHRS